MRIRNFFINIGIVVLIAAGVYGIVHVAINQTNSNNSSRTSQVKKNRVQSLELTALGDSLTYGVGDTTKSGGWVGLIQKKLNETGEYKLTTHNYGVSGNTAPQELKRLKEDKKLRADMKKAQLVTVTVGGNDLMEILKNNFFEITMSDVEKGIDTFQGNLTKILNEIRELNSNASIYVFGIYNPFYVYFPDVKEMTESVTKWNNATKKTLAKYEKAHFVDIDSVLTKGPEEDASSKSSSQSTSSAAKSSSSASKSTSEGQSSSEKDKSNPSNSSSSSKNAYIFDEDHFHPSISGYAKMTTQLYDQLMATKKEWQK